MSDEFNIRKVIIMRRETLVPEEQRKMLVPVQFETGDLLSSLEFQKLVNNPDIEKQSRALYILITEVTFAIMKDRQ